jgi:hypothetical protein
MLNLIDEFTHECLAMVGLSASVGGGAGRKCMLPLDRARKSSQPRSNISR